MGGAEKQNPRVEWKTRNREARQHAIEVSYYSFGALSYNTRGSHEPFLPRILLWLVRKRGIRKIIFLNRKKLHSSDTDTDDDFSILQAIL